MKWMIIHSVCDGACAFQIKRCIDYVYLRQWLKNITVIIISKINIV